MMSEVPVMSNEVYHHHLTGMTPTEIAEHLKDIFPEFGDLNIEEVLVIQESAFQHIQSKKQNNDVTPSRGASGNRSYVSRDESESSSHGANIESQLANDEAIARALEMDDDFKDLHIHDLGASSSDHTGSAVRETLTRGANQNFTQDDIDPDTMTYEVGLKPELQSLGESVGSESRGLSADLISRLPTFKYKSGFFSKKKKKEKEECVICYSEYKHGAKLTTLPCAHQYHSNCINQWLHQNKHCPVCQKEVRDE